MLGFSGIIDNRSLSKYEQELIAANAISKHIEQLISLLQSNHNLSPIVRKNIHRSLILVCRLNSSDLVSMNDLPKLLESASKCPDFSRAERDLFMGDLVKLPTLLEQWRESNPQSVASSILIRDESPKLSPQLSDRLFSAGACSIGVGKDTVHDSIVVNVDGFVPKEEFESLLSDLSNLNIAYRQIAAPKSAIEQTEQELLVGRR